MDSANREFQEEFIRTNRLFIPAAARYRLYQRTAIDKAGVLPNNAGSIVKCSLCLNEMLLPTIVPKMAPITTSEK